MPALQTKAGELDALRHASSETWARMTPLVQFLGPKKLDEPLRASRVAGWVRKAASAVADHPVYIDVVRLNPGARTDTAVGPRPVLDVIYHEARKRGMRFVPVAWVGRSNKAHLRSVAEAAAQDRYGLALRHRLNATILPSDEPLGEYLMRLATALEVGAAETDILLDLEFLDPDIEVVADELAADIAELHEVGAWRSVVLLGSSVPATMGGVEEDSVGALARREWEIWVELSEIRGLPRIPAYGDYAVQNPKPPHDPGGPGMRANVRYTINGSMLVARGRSVLQEGNEQYRGLCQRILDSGDYAGPQYSWGDRLINDVALGDREPGGSDMWRGAGTSHHLAFVTNELQGRRGRV